MRLAVEHRFASADLRKGEVSALHRAFAAQKNKGNFKFAGRVPVTGARRKLDQTEGGQLHVVFAKIENLVVALHGIEMDQKFLAAHGSAPF